MINDVDYWTQWHLLFDRADSEAAILDFIDPDVDTVIPLYPGDE